VNTPVSIATPAPAPLPASAPAPASLAEALAMRRAADSYLAAADHTGYTTAEQAAALIEMERCAAIATAAHAWLLGAFTAGQGPAADADSSPRTWLIHKTGVTQGAAAGRVGWSRRVQAHPLVAAALAEGGPVSDSMGKVICDYTGKLPEADRDKADIILLGVARAGARQDDIARLAAQMYEQSRSATPDEDPGDPDDIPGGPEDPAAPDNGRGSPGAPDGGRDGPDGAGDDPDGDRDGCDGDPDGADDGPGGPAGDRGNPYDDRDDGFDDRSVRLDTTLGGAGVLYGDLSSDCASLVKTVLDALSTSAGAEDTRSMAQRWHDALADAMSRLVAAGLLPDRAGAATKALVHIAFAELRALRGASRLEAAWVARAQQDWAGHRAATVLAGGDGGAWLNGPAALRRRLRRPHRPRRHRRRQPRRPGPARRPVPRVGRPRPPPLPVRRAGDRVAGRGLAAVRDGRRPADRARAGDAAARHHRRRYRSRLRPRRARLRLADRVARRRARRAQPPARRRSLRERPGRDPAGHPAAVRRALRMGRRLLAACLGLPHPPRHPQGRRRPHQRQRLSVAVQLPPSGRGAPLGLDTDPQPRRHYHRPQPRRHQGTQQPRTAARYSQPR
jgi:Domain of unknown function (DUF222)